MYWHFLKGIRRQKEARFSDSWIGKGPYSTTFSEALAFASTMGSTKAITSHSETEYLIATEAESHL